MIDQRLLEAQFTSRHVQYEVTIGIHLEPVRAGKAQGDGLRIGTRRDDEVVFKLSLVAVVDEIDPGIDVVVADLGVGRDVRAPLLGIVTQKVMDLAGEQLVAGHLRRVVGLKELQTEDRGGRLIRRCSVRTLGPSCLCGLRGPRLQGQHDISRR